MVIYIYESDKSDKNHLKYIINFLIHFIWLFINLKWESKFQLLDLIATSESVKAHEVEKSLKNFHYCNKIFGKYQFSMIFLAWLSEIYIAYILPLKNFYNCGLYIDGTFG